MDSGNIGMILSAIWGLLGIIAGGKALLVIRSIVKALSESTDVANALDGAMKAVEAAEKDGVWESGEVEQIKAAGENFKLQLQEAKNAWSNVQSALVKNLK